MIKYFFPYLKKIRVLVFKEITHLNMLKPSYPKSQPSPLRITTHTIKAMFGCSKNKEALDVKTDFKLDLLKLSANLQLDDNIRYIEYVTKSDNYIVEFENEEITDEVNISRINNNGKKNLKIGDKVTVDDSRTGKIKDFIFIKNIKGVNPKKKSNKDRNGKFYNCLTIIVEPETGFLNNLKLFRNGAVSGTGIKKEENGLISLNIILEQILKLDTPVFSENDAIVDNNNLKIINYSVVLINSDYHISYKVKQLTLHQKLVNSYKIFSTYEPCIYQGVNSKFCWNTDYNNNPEYINGKCYCSKMCNGKGNGTGDGNCKTITIAIFQSGSIIITGARSLEQIYTAYKFINDIFEKHADELEQESAPFIQETATPRKTKNIYIKKENILGLPNFIKLE